MAKAKKNNLLYIGIAVVVVIAVVIGVIVAVKGNSGNNGGDSDNGGTSQDAGLTAADLAKVDVEIEYGDFDGMQELSKAIQNGEMTGKVVKIDGTVMHPGTSYSIGQANEAGSSKIGTQFDIVDAAAAYYPADKDRVTITGKVVEKEPLYYMIETLREFVEK
ncbi:hypothetical protein IJJ53_00880 [Candidatus Saccharibacteria bacterium]|nr:hypothetical protein [Candidatus Saccharibacteria bacterium]